jgi:hypothetical protein
MPKRQHSIKVPEQMQSYYQFITALTDTFCDQSLDVDYQQMARFVTAALCRKKLSPLISGKSNVWAGAIIHAIGTINFLFDKSEKPYVSTADLATAFNSSQSTIGNKAKQIREILKMRRFDHHWMLQSSIEHSSMAWMITFNGFIVDARSLPVEIQQAAYEKGLIPYVSSEM